MKARDVLVFGGSAMTRSMYLSVLLFCMGLGLLTAATLGGKGGTRLPLIPDPGLSSCTFPDVHPTIPSPDTVYVRVVNDSDSPIDCALVEVLIELETGSLHANQQLAASSITDSNGEVEVVFSDGIRGVGAFHFQVLANGLELCMSDTYSIDTESVPVDPVTWGRIKAKY